MIQNIDCYICYLMILMGVSSIVIMISRYYRLIASNHLLGPIIADRSDNLIIKKAINQRWFCNYGVLGEVDGINT